MVASFVSAPGYRHLATQINIAGDPLVYDDFGTRNSLIPDVVWHEDPEEARNRGLGGPFAEIELAFELHAQSEDLPETVVFREQASRVVTG